jgi:geranylgeranyl pyrophosphate synthase
MRLYDETCVALCEGQYIDIATSASDGMMSVDLYFDMIGRKTPRSSRRRSRPAPSSRPMTTR